MKYILMLLLIFTTISHAENVGMVVLNRPVVAKKQELDIKETACYNTELLSKMLGKVESNNNYKAIHKKTRCLGKYQFRIATLKILGIVTTEKEFLSDTLLQEKAFIRLLKYEYDFLHRNHVIDSVGRKTVDGLSITTDGLIMASHLCGPVSVYDYIVNGNTNNRVINWGTQKVRVYKNDLNGTKIQKYLTLHL